MENSLPIFSSAYFGEIPYYQEISKYNAIFIDPFERYKKQTWRSRTKILTGNGALLLSIPIQRIHGKNTLVIEALIDNVTDWRKDHWKAIESAYMHAPYFFYYGDQIKELLYADYPSLFKFNQQIFIHVLKWLDLNIEVYETTKYIKDVNKDYRILLEKKEFTNYSAPYIQVFSDKLSFVPQLSILDLLMNQGPLARKWVVGKNEK
jgi:hypothetical protein